ncbi:hypothetical protein [Actinacidiphila sp. bgisy144]|uniref:hypothetical protein n=1 Tax=Actinacidiphila sp. bgisy144 TaxID=3413791 RepID=UPI003EBCBF46
MPVTPTEIDLRLRREGAALPSSLAAPVLLTGDNERAARHLAAQVGITDVRAGPLSEDKVAAVKE